MQPERATQRRALRWALVANAAFMGAEVAGGFLFGSLALLADAAHMLSDVAALGVALVALRLSERPHSDRHTFGLQRAEVLGAQANAVALLALAGWIVYEAARRIGEPRPVEGAGLLVVAALGLGVNVCSAVLLRRSAGHSVNMRGAFLHMALDAAGSIGAIVAGVVIVSGGPSFADPLASIAIAVLVVWSAWTLFRETTRVLLEGTPKHIDVREAERVIASDPAVEDVHHVHVWSLASDVPALSAHVVLAGEITLHEAQLHGDRLKAALAERMGIHHTTLELECHGCEPD